ncbi:MAG: hypothetical protein KDD47_24370 [Acidobacteria bacterium]|nr:hypothetical protein [Acidobacteriota bacterium]
MRALRPARPPVDPWRPLGWQLERERTVEGALEPALTVFLAGAECPFTCVFCDLWRHTLEGPTPAGALPAQLSAALEKASAELFEVIVAVAESKRSREQRLLAKLASRRLFDREALWTARLLEGAFGLAGQEGLARRVRKLVRKKKPSRRLQKIETAASGESAAAILPEEAVAAEVEPAPPRLALV